MAFGDADLGVMFADFGVTVTWDNQMVTAILDVYEDVFRKGSGPGSIQTTEFILRVPAPGLTGSPEAFDRIVIAAQPNLPPGFAPGTYTVKELLECKDPSVIDLALRGPVTA